MLQEYQRILVATDGSDGSEIALQKATAIAKRNNAALVILHVLDTRAMYATESADLTYIDTLRKLGDKVVNEAKEYAESQGVTDVKVITESGSPKPVIATDVPKRENIDLIVVGARGMGAIERLFVGSVSENVVRHAECDVVVVR
ncbi:universal stress protein [Aerococcaceae bacterium DSM 111022]|nr:universal stress protein [Aerococcaceae bacterium DSM 111022]